MAGRASFFVSYTSVDRAWAEWIAWQLEAEGYQVVVQAWDFTGGRDWVHEMQQATAMAERVVVVLSPAYLVSAHGEAEWRVFYAADPSGERGLLMPIRVGAVEPPGLLRTRVYVDLVGLDASAARRALLAAARGDRGKPASERSRSRRAAGWWSWAGCSSGAGLLRMAAPDPPSRSWPRSWDQACAGRRRRPGRRGAPASSQLHQPR
jgi:hypothetical protein